MAKYNVQITNGAGSGAMQVGTYSVSANIPGYTNGTLNPDSYTVTSSTGSQAFTIKASGTLTFTVNETGEAGGTVITSGSIVMTDSTGNTQYGTAVNINQDGTAVFNYVPYGTADSPITLYFKQLSTDASHNIYENIITVSMNTETVSQFIVNEPIAVQSFTIQDATYTGLPIPTGELVFESN